ncbi:MAG: sodium:proton antiporter [Candidatus Adiutrix sp.]
MAAYGNPLHLDGSQLSGLWALPFAGLLLSIAFWPLLAPNFWHHHYGKITLGWTFVFLVPCWFYFQFPLTMFTVFEVLFLEYIPFVILLLSLFTIAGGIRLTGNLVGTPRLNTTIILVGTVLASIMGTTGAAMLLIRPILKANAHRRYRVHTVVFFIFLVANIGGSLTPLGDPPLFLGFLKGVSFFWTTTHLFKEAALLSFMLLTLYFIIDTVLYNREGRPAPPPKKTQERFGFEGKINFLLLGGVVIMVLISGVWKTQIQFVLWDDIILGLPGVLRDVMLLVLAGLSLKITPKEIRQNNDFTWEPIKEVAKLFAGIFTTMAPAIAILKAGQEGALKPLVSLVVDSDGQPVNHMYFWLTGILSSFLDNAPTYVVFFNLAGGDAQHLMHVIPDTLVAISCGAVFMGANTYIGNAPNFMVRSIAVEQGVKMPSFFGYMGWSTAILVPMLILLTFIFFL